MTDKKYVESCGEFVLDYSEFFRNAGRACWFIGQGRVAGNTTDTLRTGLHDTPRQAWASAAALLKQKEAQ